MKTATQIASELNVDAKKVNQALLTLGFLLKVENGYRSNHSLGITREHKDSLYVIWNDDILNNITFLNKVKEISSLVKEEVKEDIVLPVIEKEVFLSATQIAKELKIKPSQVNSILVNIHFMDKLGEGYNSNHALAKQLMHEKTPYVKWKEEILQNEVFLREVNSVRENKEEFKKETKSSQEMVSENTSSEDEAFKFDRKTFDAQFRTQSGHFVRSRAEVIVADWLYNNDIMFAYEKRLPIVEELYSDFFIKKGKVYIEVWGLESTKYLERKTKKIQMYKENGYTLIGLEDKDIENLDDYLPLKLAQVGFIF